MVSVLVFAACGSDAATVVPATVAPATVDPATVDPTSAEASTPDIQQREQPSETVVGPTVAPVAATVGTPTSSPGVFAVSPQATQVPILPNLLRLRPNMITPGDDIEIEGSGGNIQLMTADGSRIGYIEKSTNFPVFLAGQPIGTINCFVNTCLGTVTIPQDTPPGNHQVSVEGGSSLTVTVLEGPQDSGEQVPFVLAASAFSEGESIPTRYSCDGEDISPAVAWSGVPKGTETLVVIMDDPDAPRGTWDHWVVFNIPADVRELREAQPATNQLPAVGVHGKNSWGNSEYGGPCPPSGTAHTYRFFLYAVDMTLELEAGASKQDILEAIDGHILGEDLLTASFGR